MPPGANNVDVTLPLGREKRSIFMASGGLQAIKLENWHLQHVPTIGYPGINHAIIVIDLLCTCYFWITEELRRSLLEELDLLSLVAYYSSSIFFIFTLWYLLYIHPIIIIIITDTSKEKSVVPRITLFCLSPTYPCPALLYGDDIGQKGNKKRIVMPSFPPPI